MEKMLAPAKVSVPVHWKSPVGAVDQPVQDTVGVGEEGVAAFADEQPAGAGLDGGGGGVEADRGGLDEDFTCWFAGLGVAAGGVVGGGGLAAVVGCGEGEAERHIGQRVAVGVDVEPVDGVGVEPVAVGEGVGVHDEHGPVGVVGRGEHEQVGQVQAGIVAGGLEVGGAEVVRHGHSFGHKGLGNGRTIRNQQRIRHEPTTWSAWPKWRGPPFTTASCMSQLSLNIFSDRLQEDTRRSWRSPELALAGPDPPLLGGARDHQQHGPDGHQTTPTTGRRPSTKQSETNVRVCEPWRHANPDTRIRRWANDSSSASA